MWYFKSSFKLGRRSWQKIALSLKRVKTKQVKERIGSLFYINGGPGAPSIDSLNSIAHFGDKELSNKFDLISPRST